MALESLPKIAPALFSAEQDLIQIYNKKSDTVGVINASLIGGNTPPSGVSGAIQFSNGSAFASDASNLFWDNTNKRLGVGTNVPSARLTAQTTSAADGIVLQDASNPLALIGKWFDSSGFFDLSQNGTPYTRIQVSQSYINTPITFGSASALSARVGIKGSGSTSATTSLLVQNSAGSTALQVTDDRVFSTSGGDVSLRDGALYVGSNFLTTYGQSIGFFGAPVSSAIVEIQSTTRGFLPPRMTDAQVRAIATPAVGLMAFNTDLDCPVFYSAAGWRKVSHSAM